MLKKSQLRWFLLSIAIVLVDQLTKTSVRYFLRPSKMIVLGTGLRIVHVTNEGAAFGLLGHTEWQQGLLAGIGLIFSIKWLTVLYQNKINSKASKVLAFLLGGTLGNLCDRLYLGYVVDFMDVHLGTWHFVFNIADVAILVATILWIMREDKYHVGLGI
jgi:signal peptidase II